MQPGSASWSFFKTAQLAPPFTNNIASLFRGDTAVGVRAGCLLVPALPAALRARAWVHAHA
jgi:hypothetical protein